MESRSHPAQSGAGNTPKLYSELADWWPLLSSPDEYAEEAGLYWRTLCAACHQPPRTLLELGSGGGNTASHLKAHVQITLVDRAPAMLAVSRTLNPECEHREGDMRTVRLGRLFDAVFIHDAIAYMTTLADLRQAIETAFVHCRPGGAALFAPDYIRETFRAETEHGGHDGEERSMRYLEWVWDPDPTDTTYLAEYAYLLRTSDGVVHVDHDRHIEGLFARADWLGILAEVGFQPEAVCLEFADYEPGAYEIFVGKKPGIPMQ